MGNARVLLLVATVIVILTAFPGVAGAEVMDKEPTLLVTWTWALVGGGMGFLGWRLRWWIGAAMVVLPALYFVALHFELSDPYVGPAIVVEAGRGYVIWSYCAIAVFVTCHVAGLWHAVHPRERCQTRSRQRHA